MVAIGYLQYRFLKVRHEYSMAHAQTARPEPRNGPAGTAVPLAWLQRKCGRVLLYAVAARVRDHLRLSVLLGDVRLGKDIAEIRAIPPTWWPHSFTPRRLRARLGRASSPATS